MTPLRLPGRQYLGSAKRCLKDLDQKSLEHQFVDGVGSSANPVTSQLGAVWTDDLTPTLLQLIGEALLESEALDLRAHLFRRACVDETHCFSR